MNRTTLIRSLRIAWSAGWGVVAVLVCVLWVRSYWSYDQLTGPVSRTRAVGAVSGVGLLIIGTSSDAFTYSHLGREWRFHQFPLVEWNPAAKSPPGYERVTLRYCVLILLFATIAAAPWLNYIPRRFSLRTLLIATTVVAVGLGLAVYTLRK